MAPGGTFATNTRLESPASPCTAPRGSMAGPSVTRGVATAGYPIVGATGETFRSFTLPNPRRPIMHEIEGHHRCKCGSCQELDRQFPKSGWQMRLPLTPPRNGTIRRQNAPRLDAALR